MQPISSDPWNSLELAKVVVGILTPLSVALLGWMISRNLKRLDLVNWKNQKLIEKRLAIYDSVAPQLNALLCFYTWVGSWKSVSPEDVVRAKRELDKTMNVYRHLFEDGIYTDYQAFMHALFETYTGVGNDARIRSLIKGPDGDRTACSYSWKEEWSTGFSSPGRVTDQAEIRAKYHRLMNALTGSFGVAHGG